MAPAASGSVSEQGYSEPAPCTMCNLQVCCRQAHAAYPCRWAGMPLRPQAAPAVRPPTAGAQTTAASQMYGCSMPGSCLPALTWLSQLRVWSCSHHREGLAPRTLWDVYTLFLLQAACDLKPANGHAHALRIVTASKPVSKQVEEWRTLKSEQQRSTLWEHLQASMRQGWPSLRQLAALQAQGLQALSR